VVSGRHVNGPQSELKNLTLSFEEINKIQVELQLMGLNLRGEL